MKALEPVCLYDSKGNFYFKNWYQITVDNSNANSHNINIDRPTFDCFAYSECEAIGKMIVSVFAYKHKPIISITNLTPVEANI